MVKSEEVDTIMSERGKGNTLKHMAILYLERNGTQKRRKRSTNKQLKYPGGAEASQDTDENGTSHSWKL